jgi:hypothetical protein
MAWFERMRRRLRNYTSDGDYPGAHSGRGGSSERDLRNANAQAQALANRPDRYGSSGGGSGV